MIALSNDFIKSFNLLIASFNFFRRIMRELLQGKCAKGTKCKAACKAHLL